MPKTCYISDCMQVLTEVLQRQSVPLVCKVFDDKTIAGFQAVKGKLDFRGWNSEACHANHKLVPHDERQGQIQRNKTPR